MSTSSTHITQQLGYGKAQLRKPTSLLPGEAIWEATSESTDELSLPDPTQPLRKQNYPVIPTRVCQQAAATPNQIAVVGSAVTFTYQQLDLLSSQLAHHLLAQGVQQADIIAVYAKRAAILPLALLGILKAGAAFMILDAAYPVERLRSYCAQVQPVLLIDLEDQESQPDKLPDPLATCFAKACLRLPTARAALELMLNVYPATTPEIKIQPDHPMYITFTSGSTGEPKPIAGTHRPVSHFIAWQTARFGFNETDRVAMLSGLAHDPLLRDIFTPLWIGATLCIPDQATIVAGELARWMQAEKITVAHLTPPMGQQLIADAKAENSSLRYLFFGGDRLTRPLVQLMQHFAVKATLINFYGTTETPQAISYYCVTGAETTEVMPIGEGIEGVQLLVLNPQGGLAGVGELGEIAVRTPYLAAGYLHDPVLTQTRFIRNPWGQATDDLLYKTGDWGHYLPNGQVMFVGRIDQQVKVRGFRIELGEIEHVLLTQDGVREAVVLLREETPDDKRLVAYIVVDKETGRQGDKETQQDARFAPPLLVALPDLRNALQQRLPDYMIPAAFVLLDAMPLTPNGKLDRRALPAPNYADAQTAFVAPRNAVEAHVAAIWASVFGLAQVGIYDNFFALGGHSLLATQIISRLRHQLDLEVPLRALFAAPQVAAFAQFISQKPASPHPTLRPPIQAVARDGPLLLSFAQQRLWFLDQLEPNSAFYNIPTLIHVTGQLDVLALEQSFTYLLERHESLRTTFDTVEEIAVQIIHAPTPFRLEVMAVADVEQAKICARQAAVLPFNLRQGPLWRAHLLKVAASEHLLVLTMHHIISDEWSMGVLMTELTHAYHAYVQGEQPSLPDLPIQYADFALWQREYLSGATLDRQLAFWREHLTGAPARLELPTAPSGHPPRPPVQSYRGAHYAFQLDAELSDRLQHLAQTQDATLFMLLLAAFNVLLARYSQQTDIVVGTPIANRQHAEIEGLIGFFVNTLGLRTQLAREQTFLALLAQVKQTTLDAYAHQDVPFDAVVAAIQPERQLSYAPIFQVLFAFQNSPTIGNLALAGLRSHSIELDLGVSKYDLSLALDKKTDGLAATFEYNSDLFEEATIARMANHFTMLLEGIVNQPEQPVYQLPLLTAVEYDQIVHTWNDTTVDCGAAQTIYALFEQQVARTPDAVAVVMAGAEKTRRQGDRETGRRGDKETRRQGDKETNSPPLLVSLSPYLTYAELNARANQLAHHLIELGVKPDTLVAVAMERSLEMVVCLLAVLKAGGAYVPIDPTYPRERIRTMLEDSAAPILLTQSHLWLADETAFATRHRIAVDRVGAQLAAQSTLNPRTQTAPEHLAYVIYTSGSTGRPKGIAITQGSVANFLTTMQQQPGLMPDDRLLALTTISFDIAVLELYLPLVVGASVVIASTEQTTDPDALIRLLRQHQITVAQATPAMWSMLTAHPAWRTTPPLKVLCGGEALPLRLAQQLLAHSQSVWNMYGPTEATVWVSAGRLEPGMCQVTLAPPIANTTFYILDHGGQVVPIGGGGELHIGGIQLARGYLNRPELTAERFIEHPQFGRLYKTGDLCRWLASPEGTPNIEYIGRTDFQVKIRGFRIELGEIETALLALDGVREAVVLAREDNPGDKRLVAYLVSDADTDTLRQQLAQRLPDYMVPSAFVNLAAMPLTPNGKTDRKALPRVPSGRDHAAAQTAFVAPRTVLEQQLAAIWGDVLGIEQVGVDDNFFALGGHSLLATQIISRVRSQIGCEVPLKRLFAAPQLGTFARAVSQMQASPSAISRPLIQPVARDGPLPLSFAQQRLWFLDQLEPDSAFYNIPTLIRLEGKLDVVALEQSFTDLIERHESLRTTFDRVDGEPVQVIHAALAFTLPIIVVADEQQAQQLGRTEAITPFKLREGPLLRAQLLKLGETEHWLLLTLHHIISDEWSMGVLIKELTHVYRAYTQGNVPTLPALPIQYGDFAVWQRAYLTGDTLDRQLSFWREQLTGAPPLLELPTAPSGHPLRPPVQSYRGAHYTFQLQAELVVQLKQLAQQHDATLFMLLLAAFNVLLARYSRQTDIVVGTPIANRHQAEIEGLIGLFVNTLVLRTQLADNPSFHTLLERVRQTTLAAYEQQDLPLEQLVEALQPARTLSYNPLFQVMLVLQNDADDTINLPHLTATWQPSALPFAKFDLTLNLLETDTGLAGVLEYSSDLFDEASIARMAAHLAVLLNSIVTQPDQPVLHLPMLTATEIQQIVHEWNAPKGLPAVDFGAPQTIHALFEQQVARTPAAAAVVMAGDRETERQEDKETNSPPLLVSLSPCLTYAELNARANQLAHHLIALGVKPDTLVAVAMERSLEMVVSLLAVLKAGGAYVPIDPSYPRERIRTMLEDCAAPILLTQSHLSFDPVIGHVIAVDQIGVQLAAQPTQNPATPTASEHLAYVIYTSGSTGQPKGVLIEHGGAFMVATAQAQVLPALTTGSRLLQLASLGFDAATAEIIMALLHGVTLVVAPATHERLGAALVELLASQAITHVTLVPSVLQTLPAADLPDLKVLITAGEACPPDLVNRWAGTRAFFNFYGPTESPIWTTYAALQPGQAVHIGRPIPNRSVYILDNSAAIVPVGIPGELYIGGPQLARGYLNRSALTAERFIEHPQFGRLYKTGDLCRWLPGPEGTPNIEYMGRTDFQVKIRGFRIELGEIENALLALDGMREAVVLAREDGNPLGAVDKRLVAYLVGEADTDTLRQQLAQRLPEYMVPAVFVTLEAMPLTPNGKLDRRALPAPHVRAQLTAAYVMPQTERERQIADVWQSLLQVKQVGIYDNFFELGGHSLLIIQVQQQLSRRYSYKVAITDLFQYPTVHRLAKYLHQQNAESAGQPQSLQQGPDQGDRRLRSQDKMKTRRQLRQQL